MDSFQVKYSNGKTSRLYSAELVFLSHALSIKYADENNITQIINWDIDKITPKKYGASFEPKLTYGDFPFETIEVDADFFKHMQTFYPELKFGNKTNQLIQNKTWKTIIISLILVGIFSAAMYLYVIPELADKAAQAVPIEYEMELGEKIYHQNMLPFTKDSIKTELMTDYFNNLGIESPYNLTITVVDNSMVNAFAMPGGYIVIFTGLIDKMDHHEELAGVLAHEYAHIHYRHSLRSMARSLANYALISLVIGDVSGLAGVIVENADFIMSMKYSREMEVQADDYAYQLLHNEGINPKGMIWLFETLNALQEDSKIQIELPEFMSSHPETMKRIEAMKQKAEEKKFKALNNDRLETIWGQLKK